MMKALEAIYENGNIRFTGGQREKGIYKAIVVLVEEIKEDIKGEAVLKRYKELAKDFDFGLKADPEYAEQLLDEHRELVYMQFETERVLEAKGDI